MILQLVSKYQDIIKTYEIIKFHQVEHTHSLVVEFTFRDESTLIARDYVFSSGLRKYAYHYQDPKNTLIFRYDNTVHWPNIATFPYHKHTSEGVESSPVMTLAKVFFEIAGYLDSK